MSQSICLKMKASPASIGSISTGVRARSVRFGQISFIIFFAITSGSLFLGLNYPLLDRTETRVAEISREILVTGDWVTLQLNFKPYYDKPPLVYWLCALSFRVFGINEFAARLIPALASLGTILSTMFFAKRWFGTRVGLLSGGVLYLSGGFIVMSRFLASDCLLALFYSLTVFSGYEAIRNLCSRGILNASRRRVGSRWMMICGASCGLGFLSKGPVIGVLCAIPFLFAILYLNRRCCFHWQAIRWAVIAFACITLPWLVWVGIQNPKYLSEFFLRHNINRFGGEFHPKPFWYFVPVLLVGGHPWTFMALPILSQIFSRSRMRALNTKPVRYLVVAGVWCVLFFSVSQCKLPTYILPAATPLSIATAVFLNVVLCHSSRFRFQRLAQVVSPQMATWTTSLAMVAFMLFSPVDWITPKVWLAGVVVAIVLAVFGGTASWFARNSPERSWAVTATVSMGLSLWLSHCVIPNFARLTTCEGICSGDPKTNPIYGAPRVMTIVDQFPDVPFYTHRNDILNWKEITQASIDEWCQEENAIVFFVPARYESSFLTHRIPNSRKLFSNPRFSIYLANSSQMISRKREFTQQPRLRF